MCLVNVLFVLSVLGCLIYRGLICLVCLVLAERLTIKAGSQWPCVISSVLVCRLIESTAVSRVNVICTYLVYVVRRRIMHELLV